MRDSSMSLNGHPNYSTDFLGAPLSKDAEAVISPCLLVGSAFPQRLTPPSSREERVVILRGAGIGGTRHGTFALSCPWSLGTERLTHEAAGPREQIIPVLGSLSERPPFGLVLLRIMTKPAERGGDPSGKGQERASWEQKKTAST